MHSNEDITEGWLTGQYVGNCEWEEMVLTLSPFLLSTSSSRFSLFLPFLPSYNVPSVASPSTTFPFFVSLLYFLFAVCFFCLSWNEWLSQFRGWNSPEITKAQWLCVPTAVTLSGRSQLPRGLRRGSTAACLLGLRVRNPLEDGCFSRECCVLTCGGLITRP